MPVAGAGWGHHWSAPLQTYIVLSLGLAYYSWCTFLRMGAREERDRGIWLALEGGGVRERVRKRGWGMLGVGVD